MRRAITHVALILVALFPATTVALEIIPPKFIVIYLAGNPERNYDEFTNPAKIIGHNTNHTKEYVIDLFESLNTENLMINTEDDLSLVVHVTAPKKIEFIFEEKQNKWIDGSYYPTFKLINITEQTPTTKSQNNE